MRKLTDIMIANVTGGVMWIGLLLIALTVYRVEFYVP